MLWFIVGLVVGVLGTGFLANRKPEWFASITRLAKLVEDKAKEVID